MSDRTSFDTVLVANRGEIAVRVIRSARRLGYRTVAVYSDADHGAPHVRLADVAVRIGPPPARQSYLDSDRIIAAAEESGARAVHPGYGFLAENADFAQACADAGLVFVGPTPDAIRLMGDKAAAKRRMAAAGVPVLPGYEGEDQDDDVLVGHALALGPPLMIKPAAGGGGKGMRVVDDIDQVHDAIAASRREAAAAFGSDVLILERALRRPRHVEVQILADHHGQVVVLGERDCSVQRRHQKVLEEAPSPALDEPSRAAMFAAATTVAREIGYVGAGTVEFLFDDLGPLFAFLEMNTRLQVEHPVTELITGLDLVEWQLRVAAGEPLGFDTASVAFDGHAIEARLYAEDPAAGFLPQVGRVLAWTPPRGDGIRVDAGIAAGTDVTAHYDPLLAKIVAHGRDRDEARRRLADALDRTVVLGVTTNRTFLADILRDATFAGSEATTAFLDDRDVVTEDLGPVDIAAVAATVHRTDAADAAARSPGLAGWTNAAWLRNEQRLRVRDRLWDVVVRPAPAGCEVEVAGQPFPVEFGDDAVAVAGRRVPTAVARTGSGRAWVHLPHADVEVVDEVHAPRTVVHAAGEKGTLLAPMHGTVVDVRAAVGAEVAAGDPVVAIEAMKMEHVVVADVDGTIREVASAGTQVADGDVVARIDGPEVS